MIHFKKVLFEFNNGSGIKDTSFNIESGEYVCIIGPTGAGKSSLGNVLAGCEPADEKTIEPIIIC